MNLFKRIENDKSRTMGTKAICKFGISLRELKKDDVISYITIVIPYESL